MIHTGNEKIMFLTLPRIRRSLLQPKIDFFILINVNECTKIGISKQYITISPQECGLLQQLLAVPSAGPRPHVGQPTPGLTSSTLCQPYPRKFNHGSEEDHAGNRRDGGGWSLADIFHGSTALVLTYNLIHQQENIHQFSSITLR